MGTSEEMLRPVAMVFFEFDPKNPKQVGQMMIIREIWDINGNGTWRLPDGTPAFLNPMVSGLQVNEVTGVVSCDIELSLNGVVVSYTQQRAFKAMIRNILHKLNERFKEYSYGHHIELKFVFESPGRESICSN